jgi:hypothetical protein
MPRTNASAAPRLDSITSANLPVLLPKIERFVKAMEKPERFKKDYPGALAEYRDRPERMAMYIRQKETERLLEALDHSEVRRGSGLEPIHHINELLDDSLTAETQDAIVDLWEIIHPDWESKHHFGTVYLSHTPGKLLRRLKALLSVIRKATKDKPQRGAPRRYPKAVEYYLKRKAKKPGETRRKRYHICKEKFEGQEPFPPFETFMRAVRRFEEKNTEQIR